MLAKVEQHQARADEGFLRAGMAIAMAASNASSSASPGWGFEVERYGSSDGPEESSIWSTTW